MVSTLFKYKQRINPYLFSICLLWRSLHIQEAKAQSSQPDNPVGIDCLIEYSNRIHVPYSNLANPGASKVNDQTGSNGSWIRRATCADSGCFKVGLSINGKGYLGTGMYDFCFSKPLNDFWEYDPVANKWTAKANFGGGLRSNASGFAIGNKAYIGFGTDQFKFRTDFWAWDQTTNIWTQKPDFPGSPKQRPVTFVIGGKGYCGLGIDTNFFCTSDFWEYDTTSNQWSQLANFTGGARKFSVAFAIGGKGYVGLGSSQTDLFGDFWEYDPSLDQWTQKADFPGGEITMAVGFSIGTKGYVGTGSGLSGVTYDFWEYDPIADQWTQKADFGAGIASNARYSATGFSIGAKGYLGTGSGVDGSCRGDFWEFDTLASGIYENKKKVIELHLYPAPANTLLHVDCSHVPEKEYVFSINDELGRTIYSKNFSGSKNWDINTENFPQGILFFNVVSKEGLEAVGKIIVIH